MVLYQVLPIADCQMARDIIVSFLELCVCQGFESRTQKGCGMLTPAAVHVCRPWRLFVQDSVTLTELCHDKH
jgi:hypothetical protein